MWRNKTMTDKAPIETFDMPDQEVFAAGTWNGDSYSVADLDEMVKAYHETAGKFDPSIKLTHDHPKGWPAVGWVKDLRRVGEKLVADFVKIPKKVFEMIQAGGFRGKSAEVLWGPKVDGKEYKYLLKAVAILGVDPKAVETIDDMISALYTSDGGEARAYKADDLGGNSRAYDLEKTEGADMNEVEQLKKDLADANAKNVELSGEVAKYAKAEGDLKKTAADAETRAAEAIKRAEKAEGELKAYAAKEVETRITGIVDKLVADGKVAPAKKEYAKNLLMGVAGNVEKTYSIADKKLSLEEIATELLGGAKVDLNTDTKTYSGDRHDEPADDGADKDGFVNSDLDKKAKEYQAKHAGASYKDALREVARTDGK